MIKILTKNLFEKYSKVDFALLQKVFVESQYKRIFSKTINIISYLRQTNRKTFALIFDHCKMLNEFEFFQY